MSVQIDILNWLKLPASVELKRELTAPKEMFDPAFLPNYDVDTLFYDVLFIPWRRTLRIICPKLLNLEPLITKGSLQVDGQRIHRQRIRRFERYDELCLPCWRPPRQLTLRIGPTDCTVQVSHQDRSTFKGLHCAVVKSKDNDLAWIRDWAEFHVKVHQLQGLLFFDNNSQSYTIEDIKQTLLQVKGLREVRILAAPFPFGARGGHPSGKFLGHAVYNIARHRFFSTAAAVLVADIDELIAPIPETTVFHLAQQSWAGFISFQGHWRVPKDASSTPIRHGDHIYSSRRLGFCRNRKYCVCPRGLARFWSWRTHGLEFPTRFRSKLSRACATQQIEYWHCRRISTDWLYDRALPADDQLQLEVETQQIFDHVFGP